MAKASIPVCPLLSAGQISERVCKQEDCAWYMHNSKTCAMYVMAHNALLDVKEKQIKK